MSELKADQKVIKSQLGNISSSIELVLVKVDNNIEKTNRHAIDIAVLQESDRLKKEFSKESKEVYKNTTTSTRWHVNTFITIACAIIAAISTIIAFIK